MYHDDTFVPSIALEGTKHDAEPIWVPASRLGGKDEPPMPLFWTIDSGDLKQGAVGDCWLIAAMSCLANYPEEIEALFFGHGAEAAPDGRYTVLLYDYHTRSTLPIVIDERVPCRNLQPGSYVRGYEHLRGGVPCFAKPNGEMWPLLLEKAMAKMLGGYGSLAGGQMAAAFRALTGCTKQETWTRRMGDGAWRRGELRDDSMNTFQYRSGDEVSADKLWQRLEGWSSRNFLMSAYIMSASVKASKGEVERRRPDGLIEGHAYSVLMTITVGHNLEGGPFRLLKLRNPWGSEAEWTGDWSDGSDTWTRWPQVADALNFRAAADGFFWMTWEDFIRTFSSLRVSHKTMRSGPGATRRAAWDRQRQEDAVSAQPDKKGAGASDKKGAVAGDSRAGREAARRMQRQRDREGSRSTSPKGLDRTQRSDYELADQIQLDAVIAVSLADAPTTRKSVPQPRALSAQRVDYDLDAAIAASLAASLTLAIAT